MERIDKRHYGKVINPLKQVKINNLFARSVIEYKVSGKVFVDDTENPKTFYVVHPYGMSLLFGDSQNPAFNSEFLDYSLNVNKTRGQYEWMQAYPDEWDKALSDLYGDSLIKSVDNIENQVTGIIELNTRVNFLFNREIYLKNRTKSLPSDCKIVRTDEVIYKAMKGSVVPSSFWDNEKNFVNNGVGFSLFYKGKLATTAYSAYVHDDKLELGIETIPEFRGKGFAQLACSALIDYSIEHKYEPVWSCRLENTGSYRLAEKLGFEACAEIPYYRLSK